MPNIDKVDNISSAYLELLCAKHTPLNNDFRFKYKSIGKTLTFLLASGLSSGTVTNLYSGIKFRGTFESGIQCPALNDIFEKRVTYIKIGTAYI